MRRAWVFAQRILKELGRDPLSFALCLGFPALMLGLMTFLNSALPAQAGMTVFQIDSLTPAIAVFSYCFVMLFGALLLSRDRSGALLIRLYASPLRPWQFLLGYAAPLFLLGLFQTAVTFLLGQVIALCHGTPMPVGRLAMSALRLCPALLLFIALGLLFGTLLSERAAPGLCSILISLCAFLGGCWMDVAALGGAMERLCRALPFYPAVCLARGAVQGLAVQGRDLGTLILYLIAALAAAVSAFTLRMRSDQK